MSGITNIPLSIAAFEIAALLFAAVIWSFWAEWRHTAVVGADRNKLIHSIRAWPGLTITSRRRIQAELIAGVFIFLICNVGIYKMINLEQQQPRQTISKSSVNAVKLGEFYGELGSFFWARLPKNISDKQFAEWQGKVSSEIDKIVAWMNQNMSPGAQYRFADMSDIHIVHWSTAVSEKHNREMNLIFHLQENLKK